jgi:flagellar M-ring protein FliF
MAGALDSLFGRVNGARQAAIIGVGVVATVAVLAISRWATAPTYVPLYTDVPLESAGVVTDKLTEARIPFQLERAGSVILVPSADVAKARVALAREALPGAGRPGLELFDKPTWGMTDFTQKVNFRRALEGELERNIARMRDVERVQVHLALEDDKLFKADTRESKASVTLAMKGGEAPSPATVRGIASLVAGSVSGLSVDHVTVVDERGNALTDVEDGSGLALSSRQLTVQRDVERHLEQKAEALVSRIVGAGNARVQVAATINFDRVARTTQAVDPEQQAIATEQKTEILPQEGQMGAASVQSATSYETTRSVESFTGAVGNVRKLTVAVLVADKVAYPAVADSTQPIAPEYTARTEDELARIEALVRNALGVDEERGDGVSVVSAPFDMPVRMPAVVDTLPTPTLVTRLMDNPKPIITIAALVVLLVLVLVLVKALKPPPPPAPVLPPVADVPAIAPAASTAAVALTSGSANTVAADDVADADAQLDDVKKPVKLPPPATTPEREQAIATVEQRPDAAVRVTRAWLRS